MGSGFFVLKGLLKMRNMRVYGSASIKRRRYWPMGVHGDAINEYFRSKTIGDVGCLTGEWDETDFLTYIYRQHI